MSKRGKINISPADAPQTHVAADPDEPVLTQPSGPASDKDNAPAGNSGPEPCSDEPSESPRRPRTERANAFNLGAWLLEGLLGAAEELQHNDLGLPADFWTHAYAARKEALLAVRALVDDALDECDKEERVDPRQQARARRGRVDIDFSE